MIGLLNVSDGLMGRFLTPIRVATWIGLKTALGSGVTVSRTSSMLSSCGSTGVDVSVIDGVTDGVEEIVGVRVMVDVPVIEGVTLIVVVEVCEDAAGINIRAA